MFYLSLKYIDEENKLENGFSFDNISDYDTAAKELKRLAKKDKRIKDN